MPPTSVRLAILVIATLLLAGCGDKKAAPEAADDEYDAFGEFGLDGDPDLGVIRGVVVDGQILPIKGASIELQLDGRTVQSNKEGAWGFGNVSAGAHFLRVNKVGYYEKTVEVIVTAGEPNPPVTKVQLDLDPSAPYVEPFQWDGYIECSMSGIPLCRPLGFIGAEEASWTIHDVAAAPEWVQSEMSWQPQQQVSDELWLWHTYGGTDSEGFDFFQNSFGSEQGAGPLILFTNAETAEQADQAEAWQGLGLDHELIPMVFGGAIPESQAICGAEVLPFCTGVGITLEQYFTVYTHVFHGFSPPDGWEFSRDGVPEPQQ